MNVPVYEISARELRAYVDPLDGRMWKIAPISEDEVRDAIARGVREMRSWEGDNLVQTLNAEEARTFHIDRIATLFNLPLAENVVLILENHTPTVRAYLNDGNHRLAAAYLRGDSTVKAIVAASDPGKIGCVLPSATLVA